MGKITLMQWILKDLTFSNALSLITILFVSVGIYANFNKVSDMAYENAQKIKVLGEIKLDKEFFSDYMAVTNNRLEKIEFKLDKLQYYLMECNK